MTRPKLIAVPATEATWCPHSLSRKYPKFFCQRIETGSDGQFYKNNAEVQFSEELTIQKEWLDPRLGNLRKDTKYVLSSVLLHQGQFADTGPYVAVVKCRDGTWTIANDEKLIRCASFEEMEALPTVQQSAYIFVFRRPPLPPPPASAAVSRPLFLSRPIATLNQGPGITQKMSFGTSRVCTNAASSANAGDPMTLDQSDEVEFIETDRTGNPPDEEMQDASAPKTARRTNEAEIEFDNMQRGTFEFKFTILSGRTTLKAHIKGMWWNDLQTGGSSSASRSRPLTRSQATSSLKSDKTNPKQITAVPRRIRGQNVSKQIKQETEVAKSKKRKAAPESASRKASRVATVNTSVKKAKK